MAIELPKAAGRCVAVAFGLLAIGAVCEAQQGPSLPQTAPAPQTAADPAGADTNLRERVERLERQNQE